MIGIQGSGSLHTHCQGRDVIRVTRLSSCCHVRSKAADQAPGAAALTFPSPSLPAPAIFSGLQLSGATLLLPNGRRIVDDVHLELGKGEIVGLLGPNGAGKSSSFSLLVGREAPTEGKVVLQGEDVTALPLHERAKRGVGYLPQESSLFLGLSVLHNLLLVLQETAAELAVSEQQRRAEALLSRFSLLHVAHTKGRNLSGGERRRTELARALASSCKQGGGPPDFLLVDEPFAGVDPLGVREIQLLLQSLTREEGGERMGILITDHNVKETLRICDRAYMMFSGRLLAEGTPRQLYDDPNVRRLYLGEGYLDHQQGDGGLE